MTVGRWAENGKMARERALPALLLLAVAGLGCDAVGILDPPLGTVKGAIILEASDDHSGVFVTLLGSDKVIETTPDGSFQIADIPEGTYMLRAEKDGFGADTVEVQVTKDNVTEVRIELLRLIPEPPVLPNP